MCEKGSGKFFWHKTHINPFAPNAPFLYPWKHKTLERKGTLGTNGLKELLKGVANRTNRTIGLPSKYNILPTASLITIYKAFIRLYLDFDDIFYKKAYSNTFRDKIESIPWKACLALTGAIEGTLQEKLYRVLDSEFQQQKWWCRKLCTFNKIFDNQSPHYFFALIAERTFSHKILCTIWYHLYNLKNVKKHMQECYLQTSSQISRAAGFITNTA